jgi:hypothetical protein
MLIIIAYSQISYLYKNLSFILDMNMKERKKTNCIEVSHIQEIEIARHSSEYVRDAQESVMDISFALFISL